MNQDNKKLLVFVVATILISICTYNLGKEYGHREGYFVGYDDGNKTGSKNGYNQGKNLGYNEGLSFRNYYIKDSSKYIVRPDISMTLPTSVADCRRADETTKPWSETASMFPTLTYFDSMKLIRVQDTEPMMIGQIYNRRPINQTNQDNRTDGQVVHRLVDCADYPTCTQLIFRGDNNLFRDNVVNRKDYTFSRVIGVEYGDSSSYYTKVRGDN